MDQGKELIKLALFGQPVKSSLSPAIHRMFAVQVGLDIEYRLIEPEIGHFPRALEEFRSAVKNRQMGLTATEVHRLFEGLVLVAKADGRIVDSERQRLYILGEEIGLTQTACDLVLRRVE